MGNHVQNNTAECNIGNYNGYNTKRGQGSGRDRAHTHDSRDFLHGKAAELAVFKSNGASLSYIRAYDRRVEKRADGNSVRHGACAAAAGFGHKQRGDIYQDKGKKGEEMVKQG